MEEILERSLSEHSRSELGYWRQLNRRDEPGSNRQEIQGFRQMGKRGDSATESSAATARREQPQRRGGSSRSERYCGFRVGTSYILVNLLKVNNSYVVFEFIF
ncbi:hypothetical protein HanIR_Chr12g0595081 [Helianthus annuus]|nr:hypothetical protein HanIR_Chr12g0595081 [Helianthus annuus]